MKNVNLILQSKGGVGKSLFLWFVAQAEKHNPTAFIDLDNSTQTSILRLQTILGPKRVSHYSLLDERKKIEREKILNLFESLTQSKIDKWFIDFGVYESEEFRKLLEFDVSADTLATELTNMGIQLSIFVVVAGKDALVSCLTYYYALKQLIAESIPVLALMNEGTFGGMESIENGYLSLKEANIPFMPFGGLGDSESGKDVIKLITEQKDPSTLNFAGRITYNKALEKVKNIISQ